MEIIDYTNDDDLISHSHDFKFGNGLIKEIKNKSLQLYRGDFSIKPRKKAILYYGSKNFSPKNDYTFIKTYITRQINLLCIMDDNRYKSATSSFINKMIPLEFQSHKNVINDMFKIVYGLWYVDNGKIVNGIHYKNPTNFNIALDALIETFKTTVTYQNFRNLIDQNILVDMESVNDLIRLFFKCYYNDIKCSSSRFSYRILNFITNFISYHMFKGVYSGIFYSTSQNINDTNLICNCVKKHVNEDITYKKMLKYTLNCVGSDITLFDVFDKLEMTHIRKRIDGVFRLIGTNEFRQQNKRQQMSWDTMRKHCSHYLSKRYERDTDNYKRYKDVLKDETERLRITEEEKARKLEEIRLERERLLEEHKRIILENEKRHETEKQRLLQSNYVNILSSDQQERLKAHLLRPRKRLTVKLQSGGKPSLTQIIHDFILNVFN